ncbi:SDR family NAD(P)-dependent oxidoreductase [Jannaschia rubra]|uniref:4-formylbenzenesulfonate dehydrogenase TsaC1/TsaC2 n=1 Tax=Jannaschia rubra TaxID=282197 RepID=A0A0M6XPB2_9RHOB|nr:SDR family NAD(P)-dependent oxidoreductase [Jannaschia rubra]CTQ32051.1 4-formylbenzenesulfonate dehydrogenase TsaC1/TsaC2 [Jannaschia rubra]SFG38838.1 3-oxoacyl-[acyl-carrier protein] reductase [Jannaschia rubra]
MTRTFEEQVAIVTGGAQGIGLAVLRRLIADGARVASWDTNPDRNEAMAASEGATAIACDVSDAASVDDAMARTVAMLGAPAILVNSAGIAGPNAPVADYPLDDWTRILAVNLTGTFLVNRAVVPHMRDAGYGRILNVASIAGKEGNPNACAYSASKAGVIAFTKSLGKELADMDIGVNCVTPAAARTPIFEQMSQEHVDWMLSKIPRARFLEVEEAAATIAFAVSPANSFTTGAVFDLSGGRATY